MPNIGVNMGKVTSRDPSLLKPGEILEGADAEYKPNDPGIWKIKGRKVFNSTAESEILGARFLEFDGGTDLFVIATKDSYRVVDAGGVGNFSDLETGISRATHLDSTHHNNKHYLHDGVNRGREIDKDKTVVLHGMLVNTIAPTVADVGVASGFILSSGNTIIYWVEERVKVGTSIIKRSAETGDFNVTLTGTGATENPVVTRPAQKNSDATHWALMATATNGTFPVGAEIAEVAIATETIEDTRTGTDPAIPDGEIYQTITVTIHGVTQTFARNGEPPIARGGDIFENSLVTDDVSDRSRMPYSFPDTPHSFPASNYIDFEDKTTDEFILFRRIGNVGVAVLRDAIWRINFLPRPQDAEFDRGRVKNKIDGAHGGVGPLAGATFSFGFGLKLAYVSRYGILTTDGQSWDVLTDDVDWFNTVNIDKLDKSVLVNNPKEYRLEFYYTPIGEQENTECMYLFYHPSHAKESDAGSARAKALWPVHVKGDTAFLANLDGIHWIYTASLSAGIIYREGVGSSDDSEAGGIKFNVLTGDLYLGGATIQGHPHESHAKAEKIWAHHSAAPGQTAKCRMVERNEGVNDNEVDWEIKLDRNEKTQGQKQGEAEAYRLGIFNDDTKGAFRLNYFIIQVEDLGESEAG